MLSFYRKLKSRLSLARQILLSIALIVLVTLFSTILLSNSALEREVENSIEANLIQTKSTFQSMEAFQSQEMTLKIKLLAQIPFVKALIATRNSEAILQLAKDSLEDTKSDLVIVTDEVGTVMATTDQDGKAKVLLESASIRQGLEGLEGNGILLSENGLFRIFTMPIKSGSSLMGTITMGFLIDHQYVKKIKTMTGSEITLVVGDKIFSSVWEGERQTVLKQIVNKFYDVYQSNQEGTNIDKPFEIKVGSETYISLIVPLQNQEKDLEGFYLIQASKDQAMVGFYNVQRLMIVIGILSFLVAIWISIRIAREISRPIQALVDATGAIAKGDLTREVDIDRGDEIGALAVGFQDMAHRLRGLISQVRENTLAVTNVSKQLNQTSHHISEEVNKQEVAANETSFSIDQMSSSIRGVNQNVESLSLSANETSTSIFEMNSAINEIANHMDDLSGAIELTSSSISEMTSSIKEIGLSIETLHSATDKTATSLLEMGASVQQVENNAQKSHELSENTTQKAQKGKESVQQTISGMKEIASSFKQVQEIISRLAQKSESIGNIIRVIDEVAEQTNLLSLNAAIIAAQAGEHGKGFAVVAEEVKSLSDRTGASTREIEGLIKDVQDETSNAVQAMVEGSEKVQKGVSLSHEAGDVLESIMESSHLSAEMVREIVLATEEQTKGIQDANRAMSQIKEMVQQINRATQEQGNASVEITRAVENMRVLGHEVKRSTREQNKGSHLIKTAVEKVTEMIHQILEATKEQSQGSGRITKALIVFKSAADQNVERSSELNQAVGTLSSRAQQLEEEVQRFKV
ncbi:MAG TPA: methyl-accepting chemotaxis protein [Nitrospiria bacterium]|jgi:methyl-accepting chemotaxis protein